MNETNISAEPMLLAYEPRRIRTTYLLNGLVHERRDRLACLDDIRRQHPPGFRAEVARIMRGPRGDQESIPRVQYYGSTSLYPHLDLACDDVADLFSRMNVPSGLDFPRGINVSTCTISRLGIDNDERWTSRRASLPASRPVSSYRPVQMRGPCRRPRRPPRSTATSTKTNPSHTVPPSNMRS